jgi:hypothetical protein
VISEDAHGPWHQEAGEPSRLPDPTDVGHDRTAVEEPQVTRSDLEIFPRCAWGDALELWA